MDIRLPRIESDTIVFGGTVKLVGIVVSSLFEQSMEMMLADCTVYGQSSARDLVTQRRSDIPTAV